MEKRSTYFSTFSGIATACAVSFFLCGCQKSSREVVKTSYYHQYGPEIKVNEWKDQGSTGEKVETLKNGVEVRKNYVDGVLHGPSTWSFPHSAIVERFEEYENGKKVAFGWNFSSGSPEWQDELLPDGKRVVRSWYEDGSPRFVEEFMNDQLLEGQYFTTDGEAESVVLEGNGIKVERTPQGVLVIRERYVDKEPIVKEIFYPNGFVKEVISYRDGKKDGLRKCFDDTGRTLLVESWKEGELHGLTTYFQESVVVRHVHYKHGKKDGLEVIFDPISGATLEEISWSNDVRQGSFH